MKQLLTFLLLFTLFSCKKNKDTRPVEKSRFELLVNKKWQLTGLSGYTVNGQYIADAYTDLPDYAKDNYFYFYDNLRYESNQGVLLKPGTTNPISDQGTWKLTTNDQFITMHSDDESVTQKPNKILELTETKLTVEGERPLTGNKITYKFTMIP